MESRLIPAFLFVPALVWPACNGGTENLGDGEGGSAGAELTSTTGKTSPGDDDDETSGPSVVTGNGPSGGSGGSGDGGNGTVGGSRNTVSGGDGGTDNSDGSLPDTFGAGGTFGGGPTVTAGGVGAGGVFGATGSAVTTGIGGNLGAGGGILTWDDATRIYEGVEAIPSLTDDGDFIYTGGSNLLAISLPDGPATSLNFAPYDARVAVDDTYLYVCSGGGSLYRMSKAGGGTQNFQGANLETDGPCRAVAVNGSSVSAAWYSSDSQQLNVRRWAKSDRTTPEDQLDLNDAGVSFSPAFIAKGALYYARRTSDELIIGAMQLDDYDDATVLSVEAEFDSEYLVPLAVSETALFYQSCEQLNRWCSLFMVPNGEDEPIPFEMYERDNVINALVPHGDGAIVALSNGIYTLAEPGADLEERWVHNGMGNYGPLLTVGRNLYIVAEPTYNAGGSMLWRLPVGSE